MAQGLQKLRELGLATIFDMESFSVLLLDGRGDLSGLVTALTEFRGTSLVDAESRISKFVLGALYQKLGHSDLVLWQKCDLEHALLGFQRSDCYRTEFGKTQQYIFFAKVDYYDLVL